MRDYQVDDHSDIFDSFFIPGMHIVQYNVNPEHMLINIVF